MMESLYIIAIVVALAFVVDGLNRLRVKRLRARGMYPPPCQGSDSDVERLVTLGRRIDAIRLYREIHGLGLKEAKQPVDKLAERLHPGGRETGLEIDNRRE